MATSAMVEGEVRVIQSLTSKAKYRVAFNKGKYTCSCPVFRHDTDGGSCVHLKGISAGKKPAIKNKNKVAVDSDKEDPEESDADSEPVQKKKPASRAKPPSKIKPKPVSKGKKPKAEQDSDVDMDSEPVKNLKPSSKGKGKAKAEPQESVTESEPEEDDEDLIPTKAKVALKKKPAQKIEEEEEKDGSDVDMPAAKSLSDELAEINGVKPKVLFKDGEEKEVKSLTSNTVYKIKRTWDHMYCTCPAWRNQSGSPVNARTCKHLKELFGEKYELARLKLKNPQGPQPSSAKKPASRKRKADDGDDDKKGKKSKKAADEDDDEGNDDDAGAVATKTVPALLLANKWDLEKGADPTGWWISEKLDGVRVYYDGKSMFSRLGNPFTPPTWFLNKLPKDVTLDGELFGGRGKFQDTVSIVKTINSPHWKNITFQIFDIPSKGSETFEKRVKILEGLFGKGGKWEDESVVELVKQEKAKGREHVLERLKEVEASGGEGLMLRKAGSLYEGRRSSTLLKIKTFYDAEAIVTGYAPGKGRNAGVIGALKCKMESGKTFNCGSGLNDKLRKNPPKVGAIIVYRFQELTRDKIPRFPTFIGEAADKDEPKDAVFPAHRLQDAGGGDDED